MKSAVELRARCKPSQASLRDTSINVRRKPVKHSQCQFEDLTLQKITEGPYAISPPQHGANVISSSAFTGHISKENASPSADSTLTPLCPPTADSHARLRTERSRGDVRPGSRATIRTVNSTRELRESPGLGRDSPGQRMAKEYLSRRMGDSPISVGGVYGDSSTGVVSSPAFL